MPDTYWEQVGNEVAERKSQYAAAQGRRTTLTESGGNKYGRQVSRTKGLTEQYWCPLCGKRQAETKLAKDRAQRVRCRECGLVIYPLKEPKATAPQKYYCRDCGTPLRSDNESNICRACEPNHRGEEPWKRWKAPLEEKGHNFEGNPLRCVRCRASIGKLSEKGHKARECVERRAK